MAGQRDSGNRQRFKHEARDWAMRLRVLATLDVPIPHCGHQNRRRASQDQVEQQNAFRFLPCELKLPRQDTRRDDRHCADRRRQKVVIRHHREACATGILREKIENCSNNEEADRKVHERDMLRVLGEKSDS